MMQEKVLPVCPRCHKTAQTAEAAFCAYCGAPMQQKKEALPVEIKEILKRLDQEADPVKKHKLISKAEQSYPDCLEIAEERLFLGRLHERSSKKLDFSVIKCYVWHMYLTPSEFSEEQKKAMRNELTAHPHLLRCLELAPDRDVFMRRYLEKLAAQFVQLFLMGSSRYTRAIFGFRLDPRMSRVLSDPAANMLYRIYRDDQLTDEHRDMMYDAFYRAFLTETGGDSKWVDEQLEKAGLPIPVRL